MNCEVDYCIYSKDFTCLLEKTNINALGMCSTCIILSLDMEFLEAEKERQLRETERRWTARMEE